MSSRQLSILGLFVVNLIYGANYIIAKGLMPDVVGPSGFIVIRVGVSVILFWLLNLILKQGFIDKKDVPRAIVCGFFGVAANQLLFFNGLSLTSPINASILMTSGPFLVLLLAAIILKEKLIPRRVLGIVMGATGAILLILAKDSGKNIVSSVLGDSLVFINAASYATYLVLVTPLMKKYGALKVIGHVFLFGLVFVLPVGWNQFMEINWVALTANQWWALVYVVIATTFIVYLINAASLKHVSPTVTGSFIYMQPFFATAIAYFAAYMGWVEDYTDLTLEKMLYALLIFAGVFMVTIKSKRKPALK
ncbi:DMT family transporter [Luteibaculum oceani]|uniref:DMT family transporter n=1 Tax=Luteibaculum oceani TaxID=1294296 RepID=A0A5C6VNM7_9FLAO|nr:DMT family transporter [Luteibaculum oceani]TXC85205.1 DMT family transporter [Luteibaculum oceani]